MGSRGFPAAAAAATSRNHQQRRRSGVLAAYTAERVGLVVPELSAVLSSHISASVTGTVV